MARIGRPLAVALLSASTLTYEILLVRAFAIEQYHHFAFMAIGVAMLGFGASGTLLALARPRPAAAERAFGWAALLTPIALLASTAAAHQIPLDAAQLLWDPAQLPRLASVYALLALPFGVGALAILLALTLEGERLGLIYGASFAGAGCGAALALAVLWLLLPERALAVPAALASLGALAAISARHRSTLQGAVAVAALAISAVSLLRPPWELNLIPYKGLPQVEAYPEARRVAERAGPTGWVVAVQAAAFRHAPGLSLAYRGVFPRQTALFVDGELADAAADWGEDHSALAILDWLPTAVPYALEGRGAVLVLGAGGGLEVWNALAHDARVTAVELNPHLPELAGWRSSAAAGPGVTGTVDWVIGDARSYVARTRDRFDLIVIPAGRAFGTSAGGVHALSEDFLHTVEAYVGYLERLSDDGVLAVTRWLTLPPRDNLRVILTAVEALRRRAGRTREGLVVVRSWATATVLVKPAGFSVKDLERLTDWSVSRRFDLDWHPGMRAPAMGFNLLDEPTLYRAAEAAVSGPDSAESFVSAYPFEVSWVSDARPYPHHFIRTRSLGAFLGSERGSWLPFAEWGPVALVATLLQSVLLAALLIVLPATVRAGRPAQRRWFRLIGYFGAIGLAYLAAEIAAIQQLNLMLGHPIYAVAAVLAAFLICSGAGSTWSDRLAPGAGARAALLAALLLLGYAGLLLSLVHLVQPASAPLRVAVAVAVLAPLAFLMGLPFPLGLRALTDGETSSVAWAWAANGFASVVATPAAALIALEAGSRVLFLVAAGAYGVAAGLARAVAPRVGVTSGRA